MKNSNEYKKNTKKISFVFVLKLTKTIIYTLAIFCILLNLLYIVGNYQNFQDKSQNIILSVISYSSIITIFLTIPVIVESLIRVFTIKNKKENILLLILMIFIDFMMVCCISFSSILGFLAEGI